LVTSRMANALDRFPGQPPLRPQRRSLFNLRSFGCGHREILCGETRTRILPDEILGQILIQTVPTISLESLLSWKHRLMPKRYWNRSHPNQVRLNLLLVCRRWRDVVFSLREMWTTLFIDVYTFRLPQLVQRSIQLSGNLPLDVFIYPWLLILWNENKVNVNLLLRAQVHRIRTFYELGRRQQQKKTNFNGQTIEDIFCSSEYSAPKLERLGLIGSGSSLVNFHGIEWDAPRLASIFFYPRFTDCSLMNPEALREIDLVLDTQTTVVSLNCLRECPNVHTLRVRHPRETSPFKSPNRTPLLINQGSDIWLPSLKVLQFSGRCMILGQLFLFIQTPELEKIIFKGMRWAVSAGTSFNAARVLLLSRSMPNLTTLRMEDMPDVFPDHGQSLKDWKMITTLELINCHFAKKFYRQLGEMGPNNVPQLCPNLERLVISGNLTVGEVKPVRRIVDVRTKIRADLPDAKPLRTVFIKDNGLYLGQAGAGWTALKELRRDHRLVVALYGKKKIAI